MRKRASRLPARQRWRGQDLQTSYIGHNKLRYIQAQIYCTRKWQTNIICWTTFHMSSKDRAVWGCQQAKVDCINLQGYLFWHLGMFEEECYPCLFLYESNGSFNVFIFWLFPSVSRITQEINSSTRWCPALTHDIHFLWSSASEMKVARFQLFTCWSHLVDLFVLFHCEMFDFQLGFY